jgi:hypothetical protein
MQLKLDLHRECAILLYRGFRLTWLLFVIRVAEPKHQWELGEGTSTFHRHLQVLLEQSRLEYKDPLENRRARSSIAYVFLPTCIHLGSSCGQDYKHADTSYMTGNSMLSQRRVGNDIGLIGNVDHRCGAHVEHKLYNLELLLQLVKQVYYV